MGSGVKRKDSELPLGDVNGGDPCSVLWDAGRHRTRDTLGSSDFRKPNISFLNGTLTRHLGPGSRL